METWVEAQRTILNAQDQTSLNLAIKISSENDYIPIIETNEKDSITNNYLNIDTNKILKDKNFLRKKLQEFKKQHPPFVLVLSENPYTANLYYYGESRLQQEVRYYPIVQLVIIGLFIIVTIVAQRITYKSTQNQLWVGMAKETAHQLGTPVSSLQGWIEMLREVRENEKIVPEIEKDISRLLLITDRFGKIGSKPQLERANLLEQVQTMVEYMRKRAGGKIRFLINTSGDNEFMANISPPLFDWVIENLLKNALDAMANKGVISILLHATASKIIIDISDTGKGIAKASLNKVFKPGFSTKKRGWGLGLTLSKRIVEQYHKGSIFVKSSEIGKGTTFRIELKKDGVI